MECLGGVRAIKRARANMVPLGRGAHVQFSGAFVALLLAVPALIVLGALVATWRGVRAGRRGDPQRARWVGAGCAVAALVVGLVTPEGLGRLGSVAATALLVAAAVVVSASTQRPMVMASRLLAGAAGLGLLAWWWDASREDRGLDREMRACKAAWRNVLEPNTPGPKEEQRHAGDLDWTRELPNGLKVHVHSWCSSGDANADVDFVGPTTSTSEEGPVPVTLLQQLFGALETTVVTPDLARACTAVMPSLQDAGLVWEGTTATCVVHGAEYKLSFRWVRWKDQRWVGTHLTRWVR